MIHLLKPSSIIGLLILMLSCFLLFQIKYKVENLMREANNVERSIFRTNEDIHILKAEWSYLTQPDNIAKIARKKLDLTTIDSINIKQFTIDELGNFNNIIKKKDDKNNDEAV